MDRKSSIIFLTIGLLLVLLFYFAKPDKSARAKQDEYAKTLESAKMEKFAADTAMTAAVSEVTDSLSPLFPAMSGEENIVMLSNGLVKVGISTKGGVPCFVQLAGYKDQQGEDVIIFDQSEISLNLRLDGKNSNIATKELYFVPENVTPNSVTMRLMTNGYGSLNFSYSLHPESYMVDIRIKAEGMGNFFSSDLDNLAIDWIQNLRQQEKGFEFEQRYTTLTYKRADKHSSKYLTVTKSPRSIDVDEQIDWVAFKNQFFSCILIPENSFAANSRLSSAAYVKGKGYLKKMSAKLHVPFDPTGSEATSLQFYFGPNDYKILRSANRQVLSDRKMRLHKVIDLGWPVVREVNRFIIIPLFNLLSKWGLNMGIVLLLLTIIVKVIVYPFTYKSYMSSAKMRALKPYVDEVAAKYPKQEDAMKKQQETMAVYSKYGVSPMGGCLPTLIQMPVWMALFFFIPNAIDLRQQSFLWATDLTGFDDIISWSRYIPLIGNHLSIFCVLFCASNVINTIFSMRQQQQAPGQEDTMKMMKWMMYLMPLIFFFSFNNYSSGLCYYYFISALTSILIMIYLRRKTDDKELLRQLEANYEANRNDPKKSRNNSMMARLEAMQKEQERLQAQKRNSQK